MDRGKLAGTMTLSCVAQMVELDCCSQAYAKICFNKNERVSIILKFADIPKLVLLFADVSCKRF